MKTLRLAWRQLRRDPAAGDIRILFAALALAVVAVTAVGFVTDRAERALAIEANRLLGGDAVVRGDAPITGVVREAANAAGLRRTETRQLRQHDPRRRSAAAGRPARTGRRISAAWQLPHHRCQPEPRTDRPGIPAPGTLWMSQPGAETLGAKIGDSIAHR